MLTHVAIASTLALHALASVPPTLPAGDVRRFGAICDGASHPLSTRFATIEAARAVYPRARSLTEEIDGNAIQRAIDEAAVGSEVLLSEGLQCRTNVTLILWKALTLRGTGTNHTRAPYDHHAQLFVTREITGIRFDETGVPDGTKLKPFGAQGARVVGLKMRGTASTPGSKCVAIALREFWLGEIEHCHFNRFSTAIAANGAWVFSVHDNEFTDVGFALRADPSCAACGNTDEWFQVNSLRFERNAVSNATYGVFLNTPGNSISINENTVEHCSEVGVTVASYPDSAGRDGRVGLRGVEIRGNYFEGNRTANIQLGMPAPDPRRQARTAPVDVLVSQNQCNFDQSGACVLVHALESSRIEGNSVRNGLGKSSDIVMAMAPQDDVALLRGSTIIAERGYAGPVACGAVCDDVTVGSREPKRSGRDFNEVVIGSTRGAATDASSAGEFLAGTAQRPIASTALIPAYLHRHRQAINASRPIRLRFLSGSYPALQVSGLPYRLEVSAASNHGGGDVVFAGLSVADVVQFSIHGEGKIVLAPVAPTTAAADFSRVAADLTGVRVRFPADGRLEGTSAVVVRGGATAVVDGLSLEGNGLPESTFHLLGGSVIVIGAAPPPGREHLRTPGSVGQLVRPTGRARGGHPPDGAFDTGEIAWNEAPEDGMPAGWVCAARPFCRKSVDWKALPSYR